jgi:monoamine oxidase
MSENTDLEGGLSRRVFFERLASVGGLGLAIAGMEALGFGFASAMAAPPPLPGGAKGTKVVILGAGHAGMVSAYELNKAGYQVTVLEPRDIIGGRCQTARKGVKQTDLMGNTQTCDFDDGLYINVGPWRIPYHHRSTLHYTKLFGVPLESFVNDNDAAYIHFEKAKGPLAGKPIRKGMIAADARGYTAEIVAKAASKGNLDAFVSVEDKEKFLAYVINEGRLSKKDLSYSASDGRGYAVLPGAGTDPGPGKLTTPFAFHDVLDSNMWFLLNSVAEWDQQRTMLQPVGGMDQIAMGFAKAAGNLVRLGATVKKISQSPTGVSVAYVDKAGAPGLIDADYCICTIPISVLKQIDIQVSAPFKAAMDKVSYTPVNKIGLQMKRRFWEEDPHMIYGGHIVMDDPAINTISLPSTGWQSQKGVLLGYYAFGADAVKMSVKKPAERAAYALAAGQKVFPEYTASYETSFSKSWHLDEHNLGGWAEWSDESRATAYPILTEPDGRIYLAGEHMSYIGGWQAGAIESAWQQIERLHARVQKA